MDKSKRAAHFVGIFILALWGGVMVYFYASGRIANYLTSDGPFRLQVLIAGLALLVLAVFNAAATRVRVGCVHEHEDGHDDHGHDDHEHGHGAHDHAHDHDDCDAFDHHHEHEHESTFAGGFPAALVLIVPLAFAAALTPDAFSAHAVANKMALSTMSEAGGAPSTRPAWAEAAKDRETVAALDPIQDDPAPTEDAGSEPGDEPAAPVDTQQPTYEFTRADLDRMVEKTPAGEYKIPLTDLYFTAGDTEIQRVLAGLPVVTRAQILADRTDAGGGARAFQLYVQCCVADARPLSISLKFTGEQPTFQDMAWYEILGSMKYEDRDGVTVPILETKSIERTEAPETGVVY